MVEINLESLSEKQNLSSCNGLSEICELGSQFNQICDVLKILDETSVPEVAFDRVQVELTKKLGCSQKKAVIRAENICRRVLLEQIAEHLAKDNPNLDVNRQATRAVKAILQLLRLGNRIENNTDLAQKHAKLA